MKVETYEIEEINSSEASTMAADATAVELIRELGLKGQESLINPETETRFAYPPLTKQQRVILKTLFPVADSVFSYHDGIIPVRVLQVISHCKDFPQTKHLEVWHTSNSKLDPVLIGRSSQYSGQEYLLARWGEALLSFAELEKQARPVIAAQIRRNLTECQKKISDHITSINDLVDEAILEGNLRTFYA